MMKKMESPEAPSSLSLRPFELPLGWSWADQGQPQQLDTLRLPTGARFLHAATIATGTGAASLAQQLRDQAKQAPVFAYGFSAAQLDLLEAPARLAMTSSALIDLDGYRPPHKVRNLVKRAKGQVTVTEVSPQGEAALVHHQLEQRLRGGKPGLRYLFRTDIRDSQRAFLALEQGEPRGLMSLTRTGEGSWHTELLLRHPDACAGLMETLVVAVVETLQQERATILDLGQVPLHMEDEVLAKLPRFNRWFLAASRFASRLFPSGRGLEGLRRFKNKFATRWEARFVAAWPRVSVIDLLLAGRLTGAFRLGS